jgi:uncharacterized membrane protein YvbJ
MNTHCPHCGKEKAAGGGFECSHCGKPFGMDSETDSRQRAAEKRRTLLLLNTGIMIFLTLVPGLFMILTKNLLISGILLLPAIGWFYIGIWKLWKG